MQIKYFTFFLLLMVLTNACKNEFETVGEWKDIPVVFGIISKADSAHYIRVEKAFLDEGANAFEIAKNPDSIYYSSLDVKIVSTDGEESYTFNRVDGNAEGYPREEGDLVTSPNYLYKHKFSGSGEFSNNKSYRLEINRGDNLPLIFSETAIVGDFEIISPEPNETIPIDPPGRLSLRFQKAVNADIGTDESTNVEVYLYFNYRESLPDNPTEYVNKSIRWNYIPGALITGGSGELMSVAQRGEEFYKFIGDNIEANPGVNRFADGIQFEVIQPGTEILNYIDIAQTNTGITSSQVIPDFTNLSEGRGIFASTNYNWVSYNLASTVKDEIRNGEFTSDLNFN